MTRHDLEAELPFLFGFLKVVTLDRERAGRGLRRWLGLATSSPEIVGWISRADAYRALMRFAETEARRTASPRRRDPLASPLLATMPRCERAFQFLVVKAGFSPDLARRVIATRLPKPPLCAAVDANRRRHLMQ